MLVAAEVMLVLGQLRSMLQGEVPHALWIVHEARESGLNFAGG